ncbi:hypothetical protein KAFR_0H03720 [Kazachstania africana CBS 2517]|uniref:Spindle pole body component KRE28 n=1 Tax=Kazachstania africana (strain ATCC 22294 / BCRC 22015 / CBS 2517 / CECT 1963 / NBRC 1671 / NRRL Y-8276) TaxID=1071382 RepID=H2AYK5_KAZAF|nr:hypothetical protein KAFR_0H03720 [Kazachstania africana CBS 2517]CCF59782.1 hypothetical protein KAFR_0H03720 [Kazachstania africana CBS 2517]
MSYTNIKDYRDEIDKLNSELNETTETALAEQEYRAKNLSSDITQIIQSLSQENDLIRVPETEKWIDPSSITPGINESNKIISILKEVYLEQESLDNFLRLTVSSNSNEFDKIRSKDDPVFRELEDEVNYLESTQLQNQLNAINVIKSKISQKSNELSQDEMKINEVCLNTADEIDECFQLIIELEKLQEDRIEKVKNVRLEELNATTEAFNEWENIVTLRKNLSELERELHLLKTTNQSDKRQDKSLSSSYSVLLELTNLYRKKYQRFTKKLVLTNSKFTKKAKL